MAAIRIGRLCMEACMLCAGEGLVDAVVKQRVSHFLLDHTLNILNRVYPPLGQCVLRRDREVELQRNLDHLV
jgi:hypothetical protein